MITSLALNAGAQRAAAVCVCCARRRLAPSITVVGYAPLCGDCIATIMRVGSLLEEAIPTRMRRSHDALR